MQLPLPLFPREADVLAALSECVMANREKFSPTVRYDDYYKLIPLDELILGYYSLLGCGAERATFELDAQTVVKIAWRGDVDQNKVEWETWLNAPEIAKEFLCPILAHDQENHLWTIMPKLQTEEEPSNAVATHLEDQLRLAGCPVGDLHVFNIGKLADRWVVLDYGL